MTDQLPDEAHVARYVGGNRLIKDDFGSVVGVFPEAFALREGEEYLSVTWVEYFAGDICQKLTAAVHAIRRTIRARSTSRYLIGNVGHLKKTCRSRECAIRVLREPIDGNDGHTAVRRYASQDLALLALLASEVFTAHICNKDIP